MEFSLKKFLQKGSKVVFFAHKTPDFGPKNRLQIWGVPPSPLYGITETGTSEKNIGELATQIAKNVLKLMAEKNMKLMKRFEVY